MVKSADTHHSSASHAEITHPTGRIGRLLESPVVEQALIALLMGIHHQAKEKRDAAAQQALQTQQAEQARLAEERRVRTQLVAERKAQFPNGGDGFTEPLRRVHSWRESRMPEGLVAPIAWTLGQLAHVKRHRDSLYTSVQAGQYHEDYEHMKGLGLVKVQSAREGVDPNAEKMLGELGLRDWLFDMKEGFSAKVNAEKDRALGLQIDSDNALMHSMRVHTLRIEQAKLIDGEFGKATIIIIGQGKDGKEYTQLLNITSKFQRNVDANKKTVVGPALAREIDRVVATQKDTRIPRSFAIAKDVQVVDHPHIPFLPFLHIGGLRVHRQDMSNLTADPRSRALRTMAGFMNTIWQEHNDAQFVIDISETHLRHRPWGKLSILAYHPLPEGADPKTKRQLLGRKDIRILKGGTHL